MVSVLGVRSLQRLSGRNTQLENQTLIHRHNAPDKDSRCTDCQDQNRKHCSSQLLQRHSHYSHRRTLLEQQRCCDLPDYWKVTG